MLSAIDTIKRWFKARPEKEKSFIVHRVEKVIYKQDASLLAEHEDRTRPLLPEKHDFTLELTIDEGELFSLDGILFGKTRCSGVEPTVFC